jgi:hypothetical protein
MPAIIDQAGRPFNVDEADGISRRHTLRIRCGEDLCNPATAVVAHEIHPVDAHGVENFLEHVRIGRHGDVLIRRDFGVAMRKQVHGYTAPDVGQIRQLMTPQMPVQQHAMHEQRDGSSALFRVANTARRSLYATPGRRGFVLIHGSALPGRRRGGMRLLQPLCALLTAHLDRLAADRDLDGIHV